VAACAQLIRSFGFANHQRLARVHLMAGRTGNLISGMAAFKVADLGRLIQVTVQTDFVGGRGR
jgi:hypothetical protein